MSKKTKITIIIIITTAIAIGIIPIAIGNLNKQKKIEQEIEENANIDKTQIDYKNDTTVEELKQYFGVTGDSSLYEVKKEFDGKNVLNIKKEILYNIASIGMIKQEKPEIIEIENIGEILPEEKGIWITENSKEKFLQIIKTQTKSKYEINENGYLRISEKNNQNENDKILEKMINDDKQYLFDITGKCYIIDEVTGNIELYLFEQMDEYQTYEYFENDGNYAIILNSNSKGKLSDEEILKSVLELIKT